MIDTDLTPVGEVSHTPDAGTVTQESVESLQTELS